MFKVEISTLKGFFGKNYVVDLGISRAQASRKKGIQTQYSVDEHHCELVELPDYYDKQEMVNGAIVWTKVPLK